MRLDKYLADCGLGSRTDIKTFLKKKRVTVNGKIETSPKYQVNQETDSVCFDGLEQSYETFVYYLLNKPKGVISATEDKSHRTVLDLLEVSDRKKGIFPVGRLDKDTHGLLLLTNNGALAHAMLSPKKHVDKRYRAQIEGVMTEDDQKSFAEGIVLKDFTSQPAQLTILEVDTDLETSLVDICIAEGKFHQVKRMVAACGKEVTDLQRLQMGPLSLDETLEQGNYRRLTDQELESLAVFGVPL
ncbi:pseudouridine synthase [Streptococcus saliviloxodontae]|uniref:Pseudouridine synthase n=1 Tax=Streptococcus saliviloxodontae TaxID=1349416 RepID=A0ABS2PMI1_9STRE|nr:pseudouridine synthase [Streptococcus saliviloxodontae]MBM7636645.1 16S rRNA pseudouridine516 synthase [Streptococcus saliviloxodontae]